ncbi:MAG: hypothetical protein HND47_10970 [Chloroflexi bacterium]|nr:hypothetical protein [Chloroflexota bacterium]
MTRVQKIIVSVLSIIAIALAVALGVSTYQVYRSVAAQPLGPRPTIRRAGTPAHVDGFARSPRSPRKAW